MELNALNLARTLSDAMTKIRMVDSFNNVGHVTPGSAVSANGSVGPAPFYVAFTTDGPTRTFAVQIKETH